MRHATMWRHCAVCDYNLQLVGSGESSFLALRRDHRRNLSMRMNPTSMQALSSTDPCPVCKEISHAAAVSSGPIDAFTSPKNMR